MQGSDLGLDRLHLLGHSWGGWLALEYVLCRPPELVSLILASTCASLPAFPVETKRLKALLPADVRETIDRHEAAGTTHDDAYVKATIAYYTQWVCRRTPFPEHVMRSFTHLREEVYETMQSPERNVMGNLKHWDVTDRLGELDLPVLITSGWYDEMTPALIKPLMEGIPGAESMVFEDSAHLATAEEPERYRLVVASVLGVWKRRKVKALERRG
jgi:L-proline amide hydrolase